MLKPICGTKEIDQVCVYFGHDAAAPLRRQLSQIKILKMQQNEYEGWGEMDMVMIMMTMMMLPNAHEMCVRFGNWHLIQI